MSVWYEETCQVAARDTGLFGQCRPSGVLSLLQEAATSAACEIGVSGPAMLEKYNALWMIARMWYRLDRPICWGDRVSIRTWHREDRGAVLYRDFDIAVNGVPAGEAVSAWVLADASSRRLLRMAAVEETRGSGGGPLCKKKTLNRLTLPPEMSPAGSRTFHYSDTDINGHVNNVKYVDAMTDSLRLEELLQGRYVSALQVGYLAECRAGESLNLSAGRDGDERFVRGTDSGGTSRFEGMLRLSPLPEKSP